MRNEPMTKEVTVRGERYQLGKMTANAACLIHSWLLVAAMTSISSNEPASSSEPNPNMENINPQDKADVMVEVFWIRASVILSEEICGKIQAYCLQCCGYALADTTFAPVVMKDGRFAAPELGSDPVAVGQLIKEALRFNISPFFVDSAPKQT